MPKRLISVDQPQLPIAPDIYDPRWQNQYNNIQRTFYARIGNAVNAMVGRYGGQYLETPNGLFYNMVDQTFSLANTAYPVEFHTTYLSNGILRNVDHTVSVLYPGIYSFQYSGQAVSSTAKDKNLYLWINRNGTDIGFSTHVYTVSGNGQYLVVEWNFLIDLQAGDTISLKVLVDDITLRLDAVPAAGHPGVPSSVLAINLVSLLPDTLPTPP